MDIEPTQPTRSKINLSIVIAILIGAWIIGMSILAAGWLITRQIAKNTPPDPNAPQTLDLEVPAGVPVLGDNNAPVTVIEFADFQCPFCGEFHKTVYPLLKQDYIDTGKIRFVFMDFPFLGPESMRSAEAARCAHDQNKFWEFHDKLFESQSGENEGAFADDKLTAFAAELGLDMPTFRSCFEQNKHQAAINEDLSKATALGVESTPTLVINGLKYEGVRSYQAYADAIGAALAE